MCRLGPDDDFVKVLDFGLVKQFGDRGAGTMPTIEELTAGTPAFMAPEIALNDPRIDGRADIYALGCVAYYLLTGETVFPGDSAIAVMLAHVKDVPLPPSLRSKFDVPAKLDALILDCLAKDKESRPRFRGCSREAPGGVCVSPLVERGCGPLMVAGTSAGCDGAARCRA